MNFCQLQSLKHETREQDEYALFVFKDFFIFNLKGRIRVKGTDRSSVFWFMPQMAAMARPGPGQTQEPGFIWISHVSGLVPNNWTIFHCCCQAGQEVGQSGHASPVSGDAGTAGGGSIHDTQCWPLLIF